MNKITIFGGCCSRDTFNFNNEDGIDFRILSYHARTSIISMLSLPPKIFIDTSSVPSKFNRRVVDGDIEKTVINELLASVSNGGMLIMDFLVERLNIIEIESGSFITRSSILQKIIRKKNIAYKNIIDGFSEERKDLFIKAWHDFYERCMHLGIEEKIIINKVYLTKKINDGTMFDKDTFDYIDEVNEQLTFIYEVISGYVPKTRIIEYNENLLIANKYHRWGLSPFHFIDDFYKHQKNKILEFY
ncbi:DUF6270 domain-containing protein [Cobetia sp. QF-1]|uniref:DUF6270 domain-containing protein n=1 Tax=Cobetia sp. QF-1 TaxID=1969833 RepID=UPI0011305E38|nr:DUF6270 domain-containing protein [Cobetia sp. QF-1]